MKRDFLKLLLPFLVVLHICFTSRVNADAEEDTWIEPDAWARDHFSSNAFGTTMDKCCKCPEDINQHENTEEKLHPEDSASIIYFKKFITMLFNRKHFRYDSTLQTYERTILFTVQPSQLDKLEQLQDPRDLDNILADILKNVRTPNMHGDGHNHQYTTESSSGFKTIVLDLLHDMWLLTKTSEIRFLLVVTLVILFAWILNTHLNIGWLPLIFGGIFFYGYLHTYLECNRELEVNHMLEIINRDKGNEQVAKDSRFVKFLKEIFSRADTQDLQQEKLKQSAKLSLGFCRPDHVLIMYFNDIFLKYLQLLLEQFTVTLTKLNSDLGFPYNILSGFLLVCVIGYILKLVFKYILSPSAWAQFFHRKQSYYMPEQVAIKNTNSQDDRISGENLKLLLNAISATPQRNVVPINLAIKEAVSGVEDVKEALEPVPTDMSPQHDKDVSTKKQNNNNSNEKSIGNIGDVTLEDLPNEL